MNLTEKIDVLDLVISILKEHEKKLDEIAYRLEKVVDVQEKHDLAKFLRRFRE